MVSLQLFGHPFSSFTQKALIALYADGTDFEFRMLDPEHAENGAEFAAAWPIGKFPLLRDGERTIPETTPIIEHLQAHHRGANQWIPDGDLGREVRLLDRIFDAYVMSPMQRIVAEALRPVGSKDSYGLAQAHDLLGRAYDWLEQRLPDDGWLAGGAFSLVECAAAPSLFYADWVQQIGGARPKLAAYRARLLAHRAVARCVDEARPFRSYFPLGAPDRD